MIEPKAMREIHAVQARIYRDTQRLSTREKVRYFEKAGQRFASLKKQSSPFHRVTS